MHEPFPVVDADELKGRKSSLDHDDGASYNSYFVTQFALLFVRSLKNDIRNPMVWMTGLFASTFFGLLVGSIYWQVGDTQTGVQDRTGALFFIIMNVAFGTMGILQLCTYLLFWY